MGCAKTSRLCQDQIDLVTGLRSALLPELDGGLLFYALIAKTIELNVVNLAPFVGVLNVSIAREQNMNKWRTQGDTPMC
jgi:hypothetical protein